MSAEVGREKGGHRQPDSPGVVQLHHECLLATLGMAGQRAVGEPAPAEGIDYSDHSAGSVDPHGPQPLAHQHHDLECSSGRRRHHLKPSPPVQPPVLDGRGRVLEGGRFVSEPARWWR